MTTLRSSLTPPMRFLIVTILCGLLATIACGVYTGPRYGKRDPGSGEMASRVLQRTSGVRNIQSRSAAERRFYPGTRFGGKRTYWQPTAIVTGSANDGSDLVLGHAPQPLSNIPYDCVYIPFVGVRCSKPSEMLDPSYGSSAQVNQGHQHVQQEQLDEDESHDPMGLTNENGISPAVTGIDP